MNSKKNSILKFSIFINIKLSGSNFTVDTKVLYFSKMETFHNFFNLLLFGFLYRNLFLCRRFVPMTP